MWLAVRSPEHTHEIAPKNSWSLQQCSKNVTTQDMHLSGWLITFANMFAFVGHGRKNKALCFQDHHQQNHVWEQRVQHDKKMIRLVVRTERSDSRFCHKFHVFIWWFCLLICQKDHAVFFKHFFFFFRTALPAAASSSPGKLPIWLIFLLWRHNTTCYLLKLIEHWFHFAPMLSRFFHEKENVPWCLVNFFVEMASSHGYLDLTPVCLLHGYLVSRVWLLYYLEWCNYKKQTSKNKSESCGALSDLQHTRNYPR